MRILYFGADHVSSTSFHRAEALRRLGHEVIVVNPADAFRGVHKNFAVSKFHYWTGFVWFQPWTEKWLAQVLSQVGREFDLVWVNSGEYFSPECLRMMKGIGGPVILYNNDDPTGKRDNGRWQTLLNSIPHYDLCVTRRRPTEQEMIAMGARRVMRVWMSYDEILHAPPKFEEVIPEKFRSDVAFIGTWIQNEERHLFIRRLFDAGINVSIWGDRWQKSPDKQLLDLCWQGTSLSGRDYVHAMAGAKITLGLLSHGNRDEHTRRSVEIPFSGGLLCAERTSEHLELYEDGLEAIFWDDEVECISRCLDLLSDDQRRQEIREAGMTKVRVLGVGNEQVCAEILDAAFR